jgi:hypothetical protein
VSRGGLGIRSYSQPGLRAHQVRFNIDRAGRKKLAAALETFEQVDDALLRALEVTGGGPNLGPFILKRIREAMRLLVEGEAGQFK